MSQLKPSGDRAATAERPVRRSLVRVSRSLLLQAEAATQGVPDPWGLALALDRLERLHDQVAPWFAPSAPGLALVATRRDAVRTVVAGRARVRSGWTLRPVGLLVAQASLQVVHWSEQMRHRELVVVPVERVRMLQLALAEIAAELEQHASRGSLSGAGALWLERIPGHLEEWGDVVERAQLVREQVDVEALLAVVRVELSRFERNTRRLEALAKRRGGLLPEGRRLALSMQRRVRETQWLVASIVLAWRGALGSVALLRCEHLLTRLVALGPPEAPGR